jgi:hypothetical protein
MPTFQVLPPVESGSSLIARALGEGAAQGISKSLEEFRRSNALEAAGYPREWGRLPPDILNLTIKTHGAQLAKREKDLGKVGPTFDFYKKNFGFKDVPENDLQGIYKSARGLVEQGYAPDEAVENAFTSYRTKSLEAPREEKGGRSALKSLSETPAKALLGASAFLPEIGKAAKGLFAPPEERAPAEARENIPALLREAEDAGPRVYNKFLSTLSNEEFMSLPREQRIAISKQLGSEIIPQEVERTLARGILGRGGADRIAQMGGLPDVEFAPPGGQVLGETTGRLLRDLGLFGMAGLAPTVPGKAALAGGLFGATEAGEQALAGEKPTLGSVATAALTGAGAELAVPLIGKLFRFLGNKIPMAGKAGTRTAGETAAEAVKPPKIREIGLKPGEVPPPPPLGPQNAKEAQEIYNQIVNDAVKNLGERGITLEMINSGDRAAISELSKEANKVADLYKQAEKMNLKEFHKQRNELLKKLPESPLEKYYAPAKEVSRTPATLAKEAERIKPLETKVHQNERRARDLQYQILSADQELRSGKLNPAEIERIRSARELNALSHKRAMEEIFNTKFEIKYGKAPATMEEISKQIETTFDELRKGIKDPTVKKLQDFKKGFDRDRALIDEANRLADRGVLPGPEVVDEYLKIHREYLKNYDVLIDELKTFIKEHKGQPRWGVKVKNAEDVLQTVQNAKQLGEAKVRLQEDKRKALGHLERPSGSFLKNALRDTRKDIDAFQKDLFKWHKIAEGREKLVSEVAKERIKPLPEVAQTERAKETVSAAKEAAKDPTGPKVKTAAERSGMTNEEYQDYIKKISEKAAKAKEQIKSGTASPETELSLVKQILSAYTKAPKLAKGVINGVVVGTIQGLSEEYFGFKPNQALVASGVAAATQGNIGIRSGAAGVATYVSKYIRDTFNSASADKLRELRKNPNEYNEYYRKLKHKYGDARAAKIRKEALEP